MQDQKIKRVKLELHWWKVGAPKSRSVLILPFISAQLQLALHKASPQDILEELAATGP